MLYFYIRWQCTVVQVATKGILCRWETLSNALVGLLSQCL